MPSPPQTNLTLNTDASVNTRVFTDLSMTTPATNGQTALAWDDVGDALNKAWFDSAVFRLPSALMNGLGALEFVPASGNKFTLKTDAQVLLLLSDLITNSAYTIFISFCMTQNATNNATISQNTPLIRDGLGYFGIMLKTNAGVNTVYAYNYNGGYNFIGKTFTQNEKHVVMVRHESGNLYVSLDGGSESSIASGNTDVITANVSLGFDGGTYYFGGLMGEILTYNAALSGGDFNNAYNYMLNKWLRGSGKGPGNKPGKGGGGVTVITPGSPIMLNIPGAGVSINTP